MALISQAVVWGTCLRLMGHRPLIVEANNCVEMVVQVVQGSVYQMLFCSKLNSSPNVHADCCTHNPNFHSKGVRIGAGYWKITLNNRVRHDDTDMW